jgi:hypothetical protein
MGLLFLDTINGQRGESPIAGQIKKSVSSFVCVRFDCPLGALAGKAHLRANCRYSRDVVTAVTSPPNFPRPVQLNLHDGPVCSERNTVIGIGISGDGLHTLELCTPVVVINVRAPSVRWMIEDKQTAAAIDKIVSRMRDVVDELAFDERRQVLLSIRAISGDIADRLEAPSSRNH